MTRLHEIHIFDEDPVCVGQYSADGIGVTYTADEVTTFLPWTQISRICSYRLEDIQAAVALRDAEEAGDGPADSELDPDAVKVDATTPDDAGDSGSVAADTDEGKGGDSGKVKEWPKASNAEMREWAQSQGVPVSASGPVSRDVATKYAAAHAD